MPVHLGGRTGIRHVRRIQEEQGTRRIVPIKNVQVRAILDQDVLEPTGGNLYQVQCAARNASCSFAERNTSIRARTFR